MNQKIFDLHPKWYRKLERLVYENSLWLGSGILGVGLILDILLVPTTFQRFGAVIVGYAVLHNILADKLQKTTIAQQQALSLLNSKKFLKDLPDHFNLDEMSDDEKSKAIERLMAAIQHISMQTGNEGLTPEDLIKRAATLIKSGIETKKANAKDAKSLKVTSTNEVILAVLGTIIWAFGDWMTNYFWHCSFEITCSVAN